MPGGYVDRWIGTWQYPVRDLVFGGSEGDALAEKLEKELRELEVYYETVRDYLKLDVMVKANPGNAILKKRLNDAWEICTSRGMLLPYRNSAVNALKMLALVAEAVQKELQNKQNSPVSLQELAAPMKELKSISDQLVKDLEAYVTKTASTLLALKAVGGIDNMPDLPPTPGT